MRGGRRPSGHGKAGRDHPGPLQPTAAMPGPGAAGAAMARAGARRITLGRTASESATQRAPGRAATGDLGFGDEALAAFAGALHMEVTPPRGGEWALRPGVIGTAHMAISAS